MGVMYKGPLLYCKLDDDWPTDVQAGTRMQFLDVVPPHPSGQFIFDGDGWIPDLSKTDALGGME